MMPKHAIILAAGLGARMRPLTDTLPKPLIPVAQKPLIDWCLDWIGAAGIREAVVNTSYRAAMLEAHLSARQNPRVRISREEPAPLETGGGIKRALPLLGATPFLAMNSDAIFPKQALHPLSRLAASWDGALDFLMLVVPRTHAVGWQGHGDFMINSSGSVRRPQKNETAEFIFTGVEIIHPRAFANAPEGAFSLSRLWDERKGEGGWYQRIRAVVHDGPWLNVGDLEGLKAAENYLGTVLNF